MGSGRGQARRAQNNLFGKGNDPNPFIGEGNPYTDADGNKEWFDDEGLPHRVDGPARELATGEKQWWVHGNIHRVGAPAVTMKDGSLAWWQDHQQHREDGPALEYV